MVLSIILTEIMIEALIFGVSVILRIDSILKFHPVIINKIDEYINDNYAVICIFSSQ